MELNLFELFSIIVSLVALIAFINHHYIKLPTTSAIMIGSLLLSLLLILFEKLQLTHHDQLIYHNIKSFDFHEFLMQCLLSFMLFAGGLNIHIDELWRVKSEIAVLATLSTIVSTLLIAIAIYYLSIVLYVPIPFVVCLLFGSLISPTDPIAVLALFKTLGVDKKLNVMVSGESLFNDGVGIVLFITFYQLAFEHVTPTAGNIIIFFCREFFGGIFLGLVLGIVGEIIIRSINDVKIELLVTLAIVMGGYTLSENLNISGPLAMVAAGICIGRDKSAKRKALYDFWELVDEILNSILFFIIGIELLVISHKTWSLTLSLLAIVIVLLSRTITVYIPMKLFGARKKYPPNTIRVLIWGGLRGGLAVALALSLPEVANKALVLTMTYSVVLFSIIVQGLTIKKFLHSKPT